MSFVKCIHLCYPNPYYNISHYHYPTKYPRMLLQSTYLSLPEATSVFSPEINFACFMTSYKCNLASLTQHVLRFIHIVAYIIIYYFVFLRSIPFYECTAFPFCMIVLHFPMDGHLGFFMLWLLWIKLLWTVSYKYLCGHMFSFIFSKYTCWGIAGP